MLRRKTKSRGAGGGAVLVFKFRSHGASSRRRLLPATRAPVRRPARKQPGENFTQTAENKYVIGATAEKAADV